MTQAYPLQWPEGQKRTKDWQREPSRFKTSFEFARSELSEELRRLGAKNPILSTNIELRQDGYPYANRRAPDDPGIAVYFTWKEKQMCFACDKWIKIKDNIQAVRKTIEALRGIERWGSGDMMNRAFSGFTALPSPEASEHWRNVLGVDMDGGIDQARHIYKRLRSIYHPDNGGNTDDFDRIQKAMDQAVEELI